MEWVTLGVLKNKFRLIKFYYFPLKISEYQNIRAHLLADILSTLLSLISQTQFTFSFVHDLTLLL